MEFTPLYFHYRKGLAPFEGACLDVSALQKPHERAHMRSKVVGLRAAPTPRPPALSQDRALSHAVVEHCRRTLLEQRDGGSLYSLSWLSGLRP